jgi:ATP-dependent Lon protease
MVHPDRARETTMDTGYTEVRSTSDGLTALRADALPAESTSALALAQCTRVYDVADVECALQDNGSRNEALRAVYLRMHRAGGMRYIVKPTSTNVLEGLRGSSPNFGPVIDDIRKQIALAVAGDEPVNLTPILLLGDPGVGKTHFAKSLARTLGLASHFVSMSSLTAGWILSGASSQWSGARPGKVAESLVYGAYANPLITLDEVDKAGGDSRYDPLGSLYSLLEPETAGAFRDEFIDVEIDASHILWIATANDARRIPEPILNRMNVYEIERPDAEGAATIARSLYADLLARHRWGFDAQPHTNVVDILAQVAPREMRKALVNAFGTARLAGRDHLQPEDIERSRTATPARRRIGF